MAIISGINAGSSEGGGGVSPDYIPPSIKYKDADEIYVQKGRYNKAGYRFDGQYQDLANITDYWDVETMFSVDVDATYSAGSTSGMLGGKVNSSWYSVFMVDSDEIVVLPFIRVDAIAYSAPSTTINPGSNSDGTTAENGWVTSNDIYNTYRLVLHNDDPTESGNVYTIADCTTGTPDTIVITGDITGDVAATEWLQMIPPAATPCLYLGSILINSSGNITAFRKNEWLTTWDVAVQITGNKSTDFANTEMASAISPLARSTGSSYYVAGECYGASVHLTNGTTSTDIVYRPIYTVTGTANVAGYTAIGAEVVGITVPTKIRNRFRMFTGSWVAAYDGLFFVDSYGE